METNRISALRNVVNAEAGAAETAGSADGGGTSVDFAFLAAQTFADRDLEREVLSLFLAQARRVVPSLPALTPDEQRDAAHLLKGSARGIGAWAAATAADIYEQAEPAARATLHADLAITFAEAEATIVAHLGGASP